MEAGFVLQFNRREERGEERKKKGGNYHIVFGNARSHSRGQI